MSSLFAYLIVEEKTWKPIYAGQGTWRRANRHCLSYLQINKYNSRKTVIGISIAAEDRKHAILLEKKLIEKYDPPYNIARWGRTGGTTLSAERKRRIGLIRLGKKHAEETLKKMRAAHVGKKFSAQHKKKISESHRGKIFTPEHRKAIGEAVKKWKREKRMRSIVA